MTTIGEALAEELAAKVDRDVLAITAHNCLEENKRLRIHLVELAKWADKAAMVLATLEAENSDEDEQIQQIIDGIQTWAPDALMGSNVLAQGRPSEAREPDGVAGRASPGAAGSASWGKKQKQRPRRMAGPLDTTLDCNLRCVAASRGGLEPDAEAERGQANCRCSKVSCQGG